MHITDPALITPLPAPASFQTGHFHIRIPADVYRWLQAEAARLHCNMAELITAYLESCDPPTLPPAGLARMRTPSISASFRVPRKVYDNFCALAGHQGNTLSAILRWNLLNAIPKHIAQLAGKSFAAPKSESQVISLELPTDLHQWINDAADVRGVTAARFVRQTVAVYRDALTPEAIAEARGQMAVGRVPYRVRVPKDVVAEWHQARSVYGLPLSIFVRACVAAARRGPAQRTVTTLPTPTALETNE